MKRIITSLLVMPFLLFIAAETYGQAIGISYENRSERPTNGIGLHFEKDLSPLPVISLNLRLHGSYFSEEYKQDYGVVSAEVKDKSYELGLGLYGGANLGLVAPYAGVGLGMDFFNREIEGVPTGALDGSESNFFYYGVMGLRVSILPFISPYFEYRYRGITSSDLMPKENGTWALGVQLRF